MLNALTDMVRQAHVGQEQAIMACPISVSLVSDLRSYSVLIRR